MEENIDVTPRMYSRWIRAVKQHQETNTFLGSQSTTLLQPITEPTNNRPEPTRISVRTQNAKK